MYLVIIICTYNIQQHIQYVICVYCITTSTVSMKYSGTINASYVQNVLFKQNKFHEDIHRPETNNM